MGDSKNIVASHGFVSILFVCGNRMDTKPVDGDDNAKAVKKLQIWQSLDSIWNINILMGKINYDIINNQFTLKIAFYKSVTSPSDYFLCRVMGFKGKAFNYSIDTCRF